MHPNISSNTTVEPTDGSVRERPHARDPTPSKTTASATDEEANLSSRDASPCSHCSHCSTYTPPPPTATSFAPHHDNWMAYFDTFFRPRRHYALLSSQPPRPHSKRYRLFAAGMLCCAALLAVVLVLNVLLFLSRLAYDADREDDVFSNWGKPGTGTESMAWYPTDFLRDVVPVPCHSHNDYWRKVPLFTALRAGCTGVEADVWLADGDELLVGHKRSALQPNRTLQSLYIAPLTELLDRANPSTENQTVSSTSPEGLFPNQTVVLLIDFKSDDAATTLERIEKQLEPLRSRNWLTVFENNELRPGPITVIATGNADHIWDQMLNQTSRDVFVDAPLDALVDDSRFNATNSYYASAKLTKAIHGKVWFGSGLDDGQQRQIAAQLEEAHRRGLAARYWDLPAWPVSFRNRIWQELVTAGVDMLNVDDVRAAAKREWMEW